VLKYCISQEFFKFRRTPLRDSQRRIGKYLWMQIGINILTFGFPSLWHLPRGGNSGIQHFPASPVHNTQSPCPLPTIKHQHSRPLASKYVLINSRFCIWFSVSCGTHSSLRGQRSSGWLAFGACCPFSLHPVSLNLELKRTAPG